MLPERLGRFLVVLRRRRVELCPEALGADRFGIAQQPLGVLHQLVVLPILAKSRVEILAALDREGIARLPPRVNAEELPQGCECRLAADAGAAKQYAAIRHDCLDTENRL